MRLRTIPYSLSALALSAALAGAQTFDSGSDGSDGALTFPANAGVIVFDPVALGLDTSDNVFNFTTVTVPTGTAVVLSAGNLGGEGKPVYWLASGDVVIDGVLDLNGEDGHLVGGPNVPSMPGAGGYSGGRGTTSDDRPATAGNGPGGGLPVPGGPFARQGGGGGHATSGPNGASSGGVGGSAYGNPFLQPLIGGSGGAGGYFPPPTGGNLTAGGGAGGGAILIASSTKILISGEIHADGGSGQASSTGSNGSGGAIRLIAAEVGGGGDVTAVGGSAFGVFAASPGRIRVEAFKFSAFATADPSPEVGAPGSVFPPPTTPVVQVTTIGGVSVVADPTGSFATPDAVVNVTGSTTIELAANNVPLGTVLTVTVRAENGTPVTVNSTPLTGTLANSTASVSVALPSGFSRLFVTASWTP